MTTLKKNAIVTGAASGMGLAVAKELARRGMSVAVWDLDGDGAKAAAAVIAANGGRACAYEVDVSSVAGVVEAAERSAKEIGNITILVNCAGLSALLPMLEHTEEVYDRVVDVNLKGPFNCIRAVLPGMLNENWGRIVNIASLAGQAGGARTSAYSAAKAGVIGLTKAVAREFGSKGVTCNCVCPGSIDTPMLQSALAKGAVSRDAMNSTTLIGRIGTVEEIVGACAYFISEEAAFATGQILGVNGGQYI
jgi:2-hydroxycyclohexanecarboxyl-CoA dehydrogenase